MREQRNDPKRLSDILKAIDTIFQYVDGREMSDFLADKRRQITNMRNFLIHGYHNVEEDLVWEAISVDLHPIREKIVKYLKEMI
ncbi:MAG: DUF86 domain-containing protein [Bacteroidaceae bacterium]|nr:DUF86 domain-containing protein [Bacteroidaceae bacterium]